jgi:hypothetical protein
MAPAFALSYGVHRQDLQPDGSWRTAEWRLVEVGGPLLMVTQREPLARLLAEAPTMAQALRDLCEWAERTGGWESPAWDRARALLRRVDGEPEPVPA